MSSRAGRRGGGRRTAAERADIARARARQEARARATQTIRGRAAARQLGAALAALPAPAEATPVEYGLDVFGPEHQGELYDALRGLGNEKVKLIIYWENVAGQRHTTQLYSRGGVRASWIVANSLGFPSMFAFLLAQLGETKYKGEVRRILSVTVEYAAWAVA